MRRVDEEKNFDRTTSIDLDDRLHLSSNKNSNPSRPTSLPPPSLSSISNDLSSRRRYASDSTSNMDRTSPTALVTSFLQYLRHELRTTASEKKCAYRRQKPIAKIKSLPKSAHDLINDKTSTSTDKNEILTLIDLLVLRVECLTNEKRKKSVEPSSPTVAEVDQNLIEYLYYLFTKYLHDDGDDNDDVHQSLTMDKTSFVHVCQTLVRNGCFDLSNSSMTTSTCTDQSSDCGSTSSNSSSSSSSTSSSSSDRTLVRENEPSTTRHNDDDDKDIDDDDTWVVLDVPRYSTETMRRSSPSPSSPRQAQRSTFDQQQLLLTSDQFSSTQSLYFSPQSSLDNLTTMVHPQSPETDLQSSLNVTLDHSNIYTRLANDHPSSETDLHSTAATDIDRMARREKKMHERWFNPSSSSSTSTESTSKKVFLGVDFPPIAVLRRKFTSKSNENNQTNEQKINTCTTSNPMNNPDQTLDLRSKDVDNDSNDDGHFMTTVPSAGNNSSLMREKQDSLLDNHFRCQMETNTNIEETDSRVMQINDNNNVSNSSSIRPPSPLQISTPSTTTTTTTTTAHESLVNEERCNGVDEKEIESKEEEKEEKKKNNSSFTHDDVDNDDPHHASGIILVNDELGQTALSREEKKEDEDEREEEEEEREEEERERASSPLPAIQREQSKPHRTEDESAISIVNSIPMDEDQIYKKVELEEIPDEEESQTFVDKTIEPTDFLLIDEEPKKTTTTTTTTLSTAPTVPPPAPMPPKFDPLVSCYEKVLAKLADGTDESSSTTSVQGQAAEQDPIALRALQRFEERMSAAATKKPTSKEEPNSFSAKGKSSWSGSMTTPRKSLENLFKSTEMSLSTSNSDSHIKPRKTFEDEPSSLSSPLTSNVVQVLKDSSSEEQQTGTINEQPNENKREEKIDNEINVVAVTSDLHLNEQQNESSDINNTEMKTVEQMQMSDEQSSMIPYRLQLEGRRRLNTLERMRERRQSRETLDDNEPTVTTVVQSSENIQDPIVRRALERFDEKNRTLQQMKPTNYDDIEDPITRRALMRLESNMKRVNPPTSVLTPSSSSDNHHNNESWFTNSYTLGSLQPTSDRLSRYSDYAQSSNPINNKTTYVSVHQRYCTPSTTTDLSTNSSQVAPMGYRQRSRSEDMLSSRDLMVGPTTDLDQLDNSPSTVASTATGVTGTPNALQRNRSSNQLATISSTALQLPTSFIKTLEPAFVRTTESTVSYVTPTQTYSAYSCEYTRPRRNPQIGAATTETTFALKQEPSPTQTPTPTPRYLQNNNANSSEIQRPTTTPNNRPTLIDNQYSSTSSTSSTSAFAPVRSSANTSSYYSSTPSYNTSHSTNASVATAPTDDPIIRRALERFNCQVQNSLMTTSAYSRPTQPNQYYDQNPRSNIMTTSGGYQSIIGRRRQTRYDEVPTYQKDQLSSVGDGYSSSVFANPPQSYYMNMSNEPPAPPPPAIPPRYRRDDYFADPYRRYSNEDYLSENTNNNNNTHPYGQETFIHHAYPATITNATSFRPIHIHYNQQIDPSNIYSRDRPQSTSSTTSTDSIKQGIASSLANGGQMTEQPTIGVIGNAPNDSVFHRMAYTGTKATLSKSSSNLFNKSPQSMPVNQLKSCEIDFDEMIPVENSPINNGEKYQRSKSVENRTRMKLSQTRPTINLDPEESSHSSNNDEQTRFVPSSKFTSISNRRDIPVRTIGNSNGNSVNKYSNRTASRDSNGEMIDSGEIENDENCSYPDAVPMRTTIPVQRYSGHNSIQSSASTSSVSSVMSRNKPMVSIPVTLDRRDSNDQTINNRFARRSDETTRVLSPPSPRRQVPVSVFSPATKIDNKRPAPAPPVSSHDESHSDDHFRPIATHVTTNGSKTPTGTLHSNDFTLIHDKTDSTTHSKKMNVFERLFRGNRKRNS